MLNASPLILGVHWIDIAIIIGCSLLLLLIGYLVSRGVKKGSDYFAGGRNMGPFTQFFLYFASMTDSSIAPLVATEVYRQGASGVWLPMQPLFSTPFFWFCSIWYRRSRHITASDFFMERFNSKKLALAMVAWSFFSTLLITSIGNIISYKLAASIFIKPPQEYTAEESQRVALYEEFLTLEKKSALSTLSSEDLQRFEILNNKRLKNEISSTISYINPLPFYLLYTAVLLAYIVMGGIKAAAYTNIVQGILIISLSAILIPLGIKEIGGLPQFYEKIPAAMLELFGGASSGDYNAFSIFVFVVMGTVILMGSPSNFNPTARDEVSIRFGMISAAFCKRLVMSSWMFCGLLAIALFSTGGLDDPDYAWGALSSRLLGPGLLGIMISGILLGHMPAVASTMVNSSALFTRNFYQIIRPEKSEAHYLWAARYAMIGCFVASILLCFLFTEISSLFTATVIISVFLGAMGLLMLFWRNLSSRAVGMGWILWILLIVVIPWALPAIPLAKTAPSLTIQTHISDKNPKSIPILFDKLVKVDPSNPHSPLEGLGRFNIENYLLQLLGVSQENFNRAEILGFRWAVDILLCFGILLLLSILFPDRGKLSAGEAPRVLSPKKYAYEIMNGNIMLSSIDEETEVERQIRLDRFFAKQKTPIGKTSEEDEKELALTFENPSRFDSMKLLPKSDWEFSRLTKNDYLGFGLCWLGVALIVAGLQWILSPF